MIAARVGRFVTLKAGDYGAHVIDTLQCRGRLARPDTWSTLPHDLLRKGKIGMIQQAERQVQLVNSQ